VFTASAAEIQPVKYVFLFIGDGVSFPQLQMAEEFVQKTEDRGLRINAMPYNSTTTTHSADAFITESSAAGTAIACGVKVNNRVVGLAPNGDRLESIATVAKQNGRKVGIISSVTINHATPASFYAHNASRNNYYEIGLDLIASNFDYFGGGGIDRHNDTGSRAYRGNIYDLAKEAGYTVARTEEEIRALKPEVGNVIALGNAAAMPYALDNKAGLQLPDYTKQAIELLDNPDGFFIMVEGGKIDWACHNNDAAAAIWDIIEFDNAVKVAFEFAEKHPNDVLIVVTGDHETGALTLGNPSTMQNYVELLAKQTMSYDELVIAHGSWGNRLGRPPNFERFKSNITETTGLLFSEVEQWRPGSLILTADEVKELEARFETMKSAVLEDKSEGKNALARSMIRILNNKVGVYWGSTQHSALPVQTSTWGNQAEQVARGIRDNTDIAIQLKQAVGQLLERRIAVQPVLP